MQFVRDMAPELSVVFLLICMTGAMLWTYLLSW